MFSCLSFLISIYTCIYDYDVHHRHSNHAFDFDILPFMVTLRQWISVESATDERALRVSCACNIRRTVIHDISKITYGFLPRNNSKNFRVAVIKIARLYIAKLLDQGINYMYFSRNLARNLLLGNIVFTSSCIIDENFNTWFLLSWKN